MTIGRPRGGTNRYWSKEDKLKLVKKVIDEHKSTSEVSNRENILNAMFNRWIKNYLEFGETGLIDKKKPGNPLAKYSSRKILVI